ncbi:YgaP family membrane protein [Aquimarina pacifica]|uniref:YgaP family membrane protein n=1 Tax=Aquimarina pacifica TaxID=1296415 RepID=UPI0004ADB6B7|nr:DUF2892 domain-containing protein [Aquimarina pacifica]
MMKKNVAKVDSLIRIMGGILIAYLFYNDYIPGTLGILLMTISAVLVLTGFMGWCPLYSLLGFRTSKTKK